MMRESCGANSHPDTNLFLQMYRLVSTFSISRPPKRSNVSSSEILYVLLGIRNLEESNEWREQWENKLDTILDKGNVSILSDKENIDKEHDYLWSQPSQYISYMAGYVARKAIMRFCKFVDGKTQVSCEDCVVTLILPTNESIPENHKFIEIKSRGFLKHPSKELVSLITSIENAIMEVVQGRLPQADTLFKVTEKLEEMSPLSHVGCSNHSNDLTRRVMSFYLTTRMHFLAKQTNLNSIEKRQSKEKRKAAKLMSSRDVSQVPVAAKKQRKESKDLNESEYFFCIRRFKRIGIEIKI